VYSPILIHVREPCLPNTLTFASTNSRFCSSCERGSFELGEEAHAFMVGAMARPLAEAPGAGERALRQVERAVGETLEHHAHVRLRAAA